MKLMPQTINRLLVAGLMSLTFVACSGEDAKEMAATPMQLEKSIEVYANHESRQDLIARNHYRNPSKTLAFFGIESDMTVVELWPASGWYTSILAPYLKDGGGKYIAAQFTKDDKSYRVKNRDQMIEKIKTDSRYFGIQVTDLGQSKQNIAQANEADAVLTFRNLHNWHMEGYLDKVVEEAFRVLKPGGVFGVVEHRAPEANPDSFMDSSGYHKESSIIKVAKAAGFELADQSQINANPKDTKDHPKGVWTLPPSLALKEVDKDKYTAIGESDRMTLKFVKPIK